MKHQKGAVTLLYTAMLLIAILTLSIASYKNVFFQAKRAQNEITSRQLHWAAEGGLECAFAEIQALKALPTDFLNCLSLSGAEITPDIGSPLILNSYYGNTNIKKTVLMPGNRSSGALKSSSNLYFKGSFNFLPDPGSLSATADKWECMAVRYKNIFELFGTIGNSQFVANQPYSGFPTGQSCVADHWTHAALRISDTKNDFFQDINLEPFEDLFGTPRNEWMDVMYDENFARIPSGLGDVKPSNGVLPISTQYLTDCADKIVDQVNDGKDLIWIYGSCELANDSTTSRTDLDKIETAIDNKFPGAGIVLVIQDGIFSVKGAHEFPGMIYHFESVPSAYTPSSTIWDTMLSHQGNPIPSAVPLDKTMYYQSGSFVPLGGYVMDAPGKYAVFGSSMNFRYNRDVVENALNKIRKIKWLKGSWHDF